MAFKLDLKDRKLLTLLDENCRQSNSQLARRVGLSKPAVEYRIRRLEKRQAIFEYYTVIDFTRLGFSQYKLYFKFQNATLEEEKQIIEYWKGSKNIVWVAQLRGRWDLAVSVLARSNFEFGRILSRFMNRYSGFILDKDVLLTEYSPIYAREYMTDTEPKEFMYGIPGGKYNPDSIEKKLLRQISTDARIPIFELSKRTGLTRDIINYRLRKLSKDKIIDQFRCYPNLEEIGINLYKIIFRTKNLDEKAEKEIKAYVSANKKAPQMLKLIGSWDLEIEFEVENEDELYKHLADIRKMFSFIIRDFDIIRVTRICKYDYFPF